MVVYLNASASPICFRLYQRAHVFKTLSFACAVACCMKGLPKCQNHGLCVPPPTHHSPERPQQQQLQAASCKLQATTRGEHAQNHRLFTGKVCSLSCLCGMIVLSKYVRAVVVRMRRKNKTGSTRGCFLCFVCVCVSCVCVCVFKFMFSLCLFVNQMSIGECCL